MSSTSSGVIRGTLDMLLMKVLANEAEHGWGICERIQQLSREALKVQQGSLFGCTAWCRTRSRGGGRSSGSAR